MRKTTIVGILAALTASVAGAGHPRSDQMERVHGIAHELERATYHLYKAVQHDRHHYENYEGRALGDLYALTRAARHFQRQVGRYFQTPRHTEGDYRALLRSYQRAASGMRYLHARRHVREDFYRIDRLVGDLHFYYRGNRYDRHGRHDGHYDRPYRSSHGRVGIYWPRFDIHWRW